MRGRSGGCRQIQRGWLDGSGWQSVRDSDSAETRGEPFGPPAEQVSQEKRLNCPTPSYSRLELCYPLRGRGHSKTPEDVRRRARCVSFSSRIIPLSGMTPVRSGRPHPFNQPTNVEWDSGEDRKPLHSPFLAPNPSQFHLVSSRFCLLPMSTAAQPRSYHTPRNSCCSCASSHAR